MLALLAARAEGTSVTTTARQMIKVSLIGRERTCRQITMIIDYQRAIPESANTHKPDSQFGAISEPVEVRAPALQPAIQHSHFQTVTRAGRYLRTVCSTLVMRVAKLGGSFEQIAQSQVATTSYAPIYRHRLQLPAVAIPEKPHKTQENAEISFPVPPMRLRYAQLTKTHSNAFGTTTWFSPHFLNADGKKGVLGA